MSLWVAINRIAYEGDTFLGVYESEEEAKNAMEEMGNISWEDSNRSDGFIIKEIEVGETYLETFEWENEE